ncbi:hypothetical protein Pelo_17967 [Pelomyxa schiedti]|nr:hypothetical protein Pelo_17967 [Pelomyxa schiedti]
MLLSILHCKILAWWSNDKFSLLAQVPQTGQGNLLNTTDMTILRVEIDALQLIHMHRQSATKTLALDDFQLRFCMSSIPTFVRTFAGMHAASAGIGFSAGNPLQTAG